MQTDLAGSLFTIAVLIFSVIMHEVAHGYAAYLLGDPTAKLQGRLTLNPIPHIDPIGSILIPAVLVLTNAGMLFGWAKPVPYNPYNLKNQRWGEAIVGSAGILTNLFLAVLFAVIARFATDYGFPSFASLAVIVAFVNLFLGLFNLIPIPPLDGFTVLRGVLPGRQSLMLRSLEESLLRGGGILVLIVFLYVFSHFFAGPFYHFALWILGFLIG